MLVIQSRERTSCIMLINNISKNSSSRTRVFTRDDTLLGRENTAHAREIANAIAAEVVN